MDKDLESTLEYLYTKTGLASAYGSINELWKHAKVYYPKVTKKRIQAMVVIERCLYST